MDTALTAINLASSYYTLEEYEAASRPARDAFEVLSELLNLPEEVGPVVVAIVAIGFPLALFFAWAFELTPEGIKRENEVDRSQSITPQTGQKLNIAIIVLLVVAVGYLLFDKFSGDRPESASTPAAEVTEVAEAMEAASAPDSEPTDERPSIAVIPFVNRSRLEEDEFFVDGVHDDLLTNLARIGSLKVISRTSVLRYRDTETPIPEIAEELGVATIMEGAVQRAGDTVRINVQLIDAATDEHLWAEIYDREMTAENLFAIQSEISRAIADALQATLTPYVMASRARNCENSACEKFDSQQFAAAPDLCHPVCLRPGHDLWQGQYVPVYRTGQGMFCLPRNAAGG